jgi:hypothetical protein
MAYSVPPPAGAYTAMSPMTPATQPTKGVGKAMIILYWLTTTFAFLAALAFFRRKNVWDGLFAGTSEPSDVDSADTFVALTVLPGVALLIAGAVLSIIWWQRAAARSRIGGGSVGSLIAPWIVLFAIGFVLLVAARVVLNVDDNNIIDELGSVSGKLRNQGILALIGAIFYAGATVMAMRAVKRVD